MSKPQKVIEEFGRVLQTLRASRHPYGDWIAQLERRFVGLHSEDTAAQRQAVTDLRGICHHHGLSDALTTDMDAYDRQVGRLRDECDQFIKSLDERAA